jgi:hypothetical protein
MRLLRRACLQVATATWPISVYLIVLGVPRSLRPKRPVKSLTDKQRVDTRKSL